MQTQNAYLKNECTDTKYIRPIHSLTFSFLFTQPYLLLFKKFIQHETLLLSLFLTTNNTEIDPRTRRTRVEAKPKRCGAEIFRETKICRINSSRTDRLGPGLSRRINTLQIEPLRTTRVRKNARRFFCGLEKRTEGRKKERKKKHRSMPRGIGFFQGFPRKEFLTRSWLSFSNISEPTVATNNTVAFSRRGISAKNFDGL